MTIRPFPWAEAVHGTLQETRLIQGPPLHSSGWLNTAHRLEPTDASVARSVRRLGFGTEQVRR
jgi:hypothetical protein